MSHNDSVGRRLAMLDDSIPATLGGRLSSSGCTTDDNQCRFLDRLLTTQTRHTTTGWPLPRRDQLSSLCLIQRRISNCMHGARTRVACWRLFMCPPVDSSSVVGGGNCHLSERTGSLVNHGPGCSMQQPRLVHPITVPPGTFNLTCQGSMKFAMHDTQRSTRVPGSSRYEAA